MVMGPALVAPCPGVASFRIRHCHSSARPGGRRLLFRRPWQPDDRWRGNLVLPQSLAIARRDVPVDAASRTQPAAVLPAKGLERYAQIELLPEDLGKVHLSLGDRIEFAVLFFELILGAMGRHPGYEDQMEI